ncbi:zinc-binding dehydrogenase [Sphingomonas sp. SUN019]|uniref:quinone oxidoreductase family protein n=1 Tax=Sphingomonas sp. SUN019 TaxID=2937788 RepID=UPI00216498BE|nr:zinc-binding dehydrogenase [Sphingomonas sp. SUN019]UVO51995.1 zinc-binding dehydrogenase [Sphingomonas sp. SUN019]
MKAAVIHEQGAPEVLQYQDMPDPVAGPDDVVIDVEAISLEGGDLLNRSILPVETFPHIVGYGAAGRIAAVGAKVTQLKVGDRVAAFNFAGSHAEKFLAPAATAFVVPNGLDIGIAATMPVAFGTADEALFEAGGLKAGETVFIQGGAGGVGIAAIQLAKAAGATVIATAPSSVDPARLQALGCDHVITYDRTDYAAEVLRLTEGRGADLVVDLVGGDAAAVSKLISTVAYKGRLSVVGLASGSAPSVAFWDIVPKNMTVRGVLFGIEMGTPRGRSMIEELFARAATGELTMPIERSFPLAEAAAAHRFVEENRPLGRVLLIP